jgi:hypothetical protein
MAGPALFRRMLVCHSFFKFQGPEVVGKQKKANPSFYLLRQKSESIPFAATHHHVPLLGHP